MRGLRGCIGKGASVRGAWRVGRGRILRGGEGCVGQEKSFIAIADHIAKVVRRARAGAAGVVRVSCTDSG